ncbi:MAG: TRCF domain-containing protein, partial [Anaerolineales bacterium]
RELRGEMVDDAPDPAIDVHVDAYIPPEYVSDDIQRMTLYRRLGAAQTLEGVEALAEEIEDRYGVVPRPLAHLLGAVRLRTLGKRVGASAVTREDPQYTIRLRAGAYLPEPVQRRLRAAYGRRVQVTPATVTVRTSGVQFADQVTEVREIMEALAHFVRDPDGRSQGLPAPELQATSAGRPSRPPDNTRRRHK